MWRIIRNKRLTLLMLIELGFEAYVAAGEASETLEKAPYLLVAMNMKGFEATHADSQAGGFTGTTHSIGATGIGPQASCQLDVLFASLRNIGLRGTAGGLRDGSPD
ncbi:MAG TPA: hypothetical protein V6D17_03130 [Candidatus Obscuribacterales bacterium]